MLLGFFIGILSRKNFSLPKGGTNELEKWVEEQRQSGGEADGLWAYNEGRGVGYGLWECAVYELRA